MNDEKIQFNEILKELNMVLKGVTQSLIHLSDVFSVFTSNLRSVYCCPRCKNVLYYDFIEDGKVRLFCPNCKNMFFLKFVK